MLCDAGLSGDPPPRGDWPPTHASKGDARLNTAVGLALTNSKQTQIVRDTGNSARRKPPRRSPVPV
jgi:hypothetical protein